MTLNLRDSKLSQTERQVNAFIMSCLLTHFLICHADVITRKKARRGSRHGRIKTKHTNTRSQFVHSKITIFFANKRKEAKENAQTG